MSVQTLNNVGLQNNWDAGSGGWKPGMDQNMAYSDALLMPNVFSMTTDLPSSPAAGDRYIVPHGEGNGDKIGIWSGTAWLFATPLPGWTVFVADLNKWFTWIAGQGWRVRGMRESARSGRSVASSSGTLVIDLTQGEAWELTLTENVTAFTLTNPVPAPDLNRITVLVSQDSTGGHTMALPPTTKTEGGLGYVPTPGANSVDLLTFSSFDGGVTWFLVAAENFS